MCEPSVRARSSGVPGLAASGVLGLAASGVLALAASGVLVPRVRVPRVCSLAASRVAGAFVRCVRVEQRRLRERRTPCAQRLRQPAPARCRCRDGRGIRSGNRAALRAQFVRARSEAAACVALRRKRRNQVSCSESTQGASGGVLAHTEVRGQGANVAAHDATADGILFGVLGEIFERAPRHRPQPAPQLTSLAHLTDRRRPADPRATAAARRGGRASCGRALPPGGPRGHSMLDTGERVRRRRPGQCATPPRPPRPSTPRAGHPTTVSQRSPLSAPHA